MITSLVTVRASDKDLLLADYHNRQIVNNTSSLVGMKDRRNSEYTRLQDFIEEFQKQKVEKIVALSVKSCGFNDELFSMFTDSIHSKFSELKVLDISFNPLTQRSAKSLKKWIESNKKLDFIDVCGTQIALKNIENLSDALLMLTKDHGQNNELLKKIIFVHKDYVSRAGSPNIKIYSKLVKQGKIPENWVDIHKSFYKNSLVRTLEDYANKESYARTVSITTFPSDSQIDLEDTLSGEDQQTDIRDKVKEEMTQMNPQELEELAKFMASLKMKSK